MAFDSASTRPLLNYHCRECRTVTSLSDLNDALTAYRGVQFSIRTGVRAYFERKEAARSAVLAAVASCRAERVAP